MESMFPYRPLFRTILALWISSKWSLTAVGAAAMLTWMIVTVARGEGGIFVARHWGT